MNNYNAKDDKSKLAHTIIGAIAGAAIAGLISYYVTKYSVEKQSAITLSFVKEQFNARVEEYPKLWQILLPLSSQSKVEFTQELAQSVAEKINWWFYDKGGLVAHQNTRSLVFQLRNVLAVWKPPPGWNTSDRPAEITKLKEDIIASCRIDLYLVSRRDVDNIETLREYIKKRNSEIEELDEKIKPL
jgi:hypothetical protein